MKITKNQRIKLVKNTKPQMVLKKFEVCDYFVRLPLEMR